MILAPIVGTAIPQIFQIGSRDYLPTDVIQNAHAAGLAASLRGMVGGGGMIYGVGVLGKVLFRKEAMGFGDVKLMAFLGGFLGWAHILIVLMLACIVGSVVGIVSFLITKDRYLAFGPYLALGAVIILLATEPVHAAIRWYIGLLAPAG
jgi:prepilin signal peptidase PulO-like enzyme (type II secretory pathway)